MNNTTLVVQIFEATEDLLCHSFDNTDSQTIAIVPVNSNESYKARLCLNP